MSTLKANLLLVTALVSITAPVIWLGSGEFAERGSDERPTLISLCLLTIAERLHPGRRLLIDDARMTGRSITAAEAAAFRLALVEHQTGRRPAVAPVARPDTAAADGPGSHLLIEAEIAYRLPRGGPLVARCQAVTDETADPAAFIPLRTEVLLLADEALAAMR